MNHPTSPLRTLTAIEARVLGTLMEKARTVPDSYPLSLNAVVIGCNQKTTRDPLMNLSEAQTQEALDELKLLGLVREVSGNRVTRYEHNLQRALAVPEQSAVLLGLLMLRGPQTAGELRINSERWYRFADISSVEGFLDELKERSEEKGGPLVTCLPRAPGTREQRWAQLLCGTDPQYVSTIYPAEEATLVRRVSELESKIAELELKVERLLLALGEQPN